MSRGSAKQSDPAPGFPEYRSVARATVPRPATQPAQPGEDAPAPSQLEEAAPGTVVVADTPESAVRVVRSMNPWLVAICLIVPLGALIYNQVSLAKLQSRVDFTDIVAVNRIHDAINQNKDLARSIGQQISKLRAPQNPRAPWDALVDLYGEGLKRSPEFRNAILDEFKSANARGYYNLLERQCRADPDKGIRDRADKDLKSHIGFLSESMFSDTKAVRVEAASDLESDFSSELFALDCVLWANDRHPTFDPGIFNSLHVLRNLDPRLLQQRKEALFRFLNRVKSLPNARVQSGVLLVEERIQLGTGAPVKSRASDLE